MNFDHSNFTGPQPNYFEGSKQDFYTFLVKNFTLPAATVLDMTNDQGTVGINIFDAVILFFFIGTLSRVSLQCGRHAICAVERSKSETIANLSSNTH